MASLFDISKHPKVLNPTTVAKLEEANRVVRQLRRLGCRIVRQQIGGPGEMTEIVIDRNPHLVLNGCPSVHVTCGGGK